MSVHGLRLAAAVACLLGLAAGCRSMLELPESARAGGYTNDDVPEGWLFDRLTGRSRKPAEPNSSVARHDVPGSVQPASHVETTSPPIGDVSPAGEAWAASDVESEADEDAGLQLSDFYPSNIAATVKELTGNGPNEAVARALYQEGEELFQEGQYKEAAARFKTAAKRAPESPLQEDCLFMLGESRFFCDEYPEANDAYAELLKKYEYTRHLDKVVARQFAIGRYWEQLNAADPAWLLGFQWSDSTRPKFDTWGRAMKAYHSVRMNDPTGPLADDSIMATGNAYFLKGRYEEAAHQYDLIRKEYPKSEHQLNANLLGMTSKLKMYQGPRYDGTPLEDASEIAEQTLLQFRNELGSERDRVVQTQNRILEERAKREWSVAQYYERKKHYGAARYYYQFILDEYPTTVVAQKASARLNQIKDLPANPPNHFKWLTDLFPSTED